MRDLLKAGGVVALSAGVFAVLYPMAGGSSPAPPDASAVVGNCSTVGGQSGVGGQSTVGGQSAVCAMRPTTPHIANIPLHAIDGGTFVAVVVTDGDGRRFVTSETPRICNVDRDGLRVWFSGVGTCTLTAHVSAGWGYTAANGAPQSFAVAAHWIWRQRGPGRRAAE